MVGTRVSAVDESIDGLTPEKSSKVADLAELERELTELRRRLVDTPRQLSRLETEVRDINRELSRANARNQKLNTTLQTARERIAVLREEVAKLSEPPSAYGTVLQVNEDETVDVHSGGRKMRVGVLPDLVHEIEPGQEVVLNDSIAIVQYLINQ